MGLRARTVAVFTWASIAAVSAAALTACVGGSKSISAEDKERLKAYILAAPPADIPHKIDINFENKVHIIGYKIEPEVAKPGQEVKLTYYWRSDDSVDEGWKLFTHLRDDVADKSDNLDNVGPIRELKNDKQVLGPDKWEKGKIYVDEQTYKIPDWVKAAEIPVMIGIWKGGARLHIVSGPNDGDNRAIVAKIKTGLVPTKDEHTRGNEPPTLTVNKLAANEKITIDGKADEKAWGAAASTGPFVDVGTGKPNTAFPVNGSAKLLWDDTNLYVHFEVQDPDVVGYFTDKDKQKGDFTAAGQPKLWTKDTVEIMVDPDGDGDNKNYYELQINPQNKLFSSQFDTYNGPKTEPDGPFGHEDWDPKLKSAVVVKGTIDKAGDKDEGYSVEVAIPWKSFAKGAANVPPKPGDTWRMNFYAMQQNGGVAWSPILGQGNFHKATRFGKVVWSIPGMEVGANAADAGAGAAPVAEGKGATRGADKDAKDVKTTAGTVPPPAPKAPASAKPE